MIAYKFLAPGAVGPFSGFRWPIPMGGAPGAWVDADAEDPGKRIHASRAHDLAFWLGPELWRAELADPVVEGQRQIIGARGRLLGQVSGWNDATAARLAEATALRLRDRIVASLRSASSVAEADRLARCRTLHDVQLVAQAISSRGGPVASLAAYLTEAAEAALSGDAAVALFIAARAAVAASGGDEREFAAERESQARWLTAELHLE